MAWVMLTAMDTMDALHDARHALDAMGDMDAITSMKVFTSIDAMGSTMLLWLWVYGR